MSINTPTRHATLVVAWSILSLCNMGRADIATGLTAYFKLDESTGAVAADATGTTSGATIQNFTSDANWRPSSGRTNGAYYFSDGQYASIGDPTSKLDFSGSSSPTLTVSVWIKTPPSFREPNGVGIVAKGYGRGGEQYALDLYENAPRFFVQSSAGTYYNARADIGGPLGTNSVPVNSGAWTHLAGVLDTTSMPAVIKVFINGKLAMTNAAGAVSLMNSSQETTIGAREDNSTSGYNLCFTGLIDDVRIYSRALSDPEIQELYDSVGHVGPSFVVAPGDTTNFVLSATTLNAVADGTVPVSYQWQWYGTNLPNATNGTYTIASSQLSHSGPYTVVATNLYGSITSTPGVLTIVDLAADDITTALAAQWTFDETSGATAADSSGRGNALTLFNFPADNSQWVAGARVGSALRFNASADDVNGGTNDYCLTATPLQLPYNSNLFTFSYWVKLDITPYGANPRVITPTNGTWLLWSSAGGMRIYNGTPGASVPQIGRWTHYIITYDRVNNRYSAYVNGMKQVTNLTVAAKAVPNGIWKIGHNEGVNDADYFRGMLDDLRVYNRMLSDSQAAALYASYPPFFQVTAQPQSQAKMERDPVTFSVTVDSSAPVQYQWQRNGTNIQGATNASYTMPYVALTDDQAKFRVAVNSSTGNATSSEATLTVTALPPSADFTNNLKAWWRFDETSGSAAKDSSGNGVDATLYNFQTDDSQWRPGILGNALRFGSGPSGMTNFVATDQNVSFADPDNFTFSFWARRDPGTQGTNPRIISPATVHWVLWRPSETAGAGPAGVGLYQPATSPQPTSNAWTHFICVVDRPANVYSLYVNGVRSVFRATPAGQSTKPAPPEVQWIIGHSENLNSHIDSFRGLLDDVRIYNRQFNINDAEALYMDSARAANLQPRLSISLDGTTATLSWPSWASGFVLQTTDQLAGAATVWTQVPGNATLSGGSRKQTDAVGTAPKYYRLRY